ncbi:MAG: hypothetical protein HKN21_16955, partial [Candidatus Eisenbacteria bacterium]|nr:hypothetical protein [Candidatus Eisenbacteria bacterium]
PTEPGFYRLTVEDFTSGKVICIKAFVMVPYHGTEELNGYRIGTYESEPMENDPTSGPPKGFIEVTPENMNTWVSPNFQLKQFLCKQEAEFPKYMLLRTRLLLKLEMVAEDLERTHGEPPVLHVMSAYRTPYYNRRIGNRTKYSRHLFGDAADIFLDNNNDEWMDDLSGDGRVSTQDAGIMYEQIDTLYQTSWYDPFIGGMGLYGPKYDRGPFVHVDTRGYHARWGDKRGKTWLRAKGLVIEDSNSIVNKRLVDEPVTYDIDSRFRKFQRIKR